MGQQILRALLIGLILISVIDLSFKTFGIQTPESPEAIRNQAQKLPPNSSSLFQNLLGVFFGLHFVNNKQFNIWSFLSDNT